MRVVQVVLIAVLATSCGGWGVRAPRDHVFDVGQGLFNGYPNRKITCFECHDGDGSGTSHGPALATVVPRLGDTELRAAILDGSGTMPGFRGKISEDELREITRWVRSAFGAPGH